MLWDLKASFYDGMRRFPVIRRIHEGEIRSLRRMMHLHGESPPTILDAGIGTGTSLDAYPRTSLRIGLDLSLPMARRAERRGAVAVVGDVRRLPFRPRSLSFVTSVGVSEYIRDIDDYLEEIRRVIPPSGGALVTMAPPAFLNRLRFLLGHRLYLRGQEAWEAAVRRSGFRIVGRERTRLQRMYLLAVPGRTDDFPPSGSPFFC